jgi:hypothetical protein
LLYQRNNDAFAVSKLDSIKIKETDCLLFFHFSIKLKKHRKDLSHYLEDLSDTTTHTRLSDGLFLSQKKRNFFIFNQI